MWGPLGSDGDRVRGRCIWSAVAWGWEQAYTIFMLGPAWRAAAAEWSCLHCYRCAWKGRLSRALLSSRCAWLCHPTLRYLCHISGQCGGPCGHIYTGSIESMNSKIWSRLLLLSKSTSLHENPPRDPQIPKHDTFAVLPMYAFPLSHEHPLVGGMHARRCPATWRW